MKQTYFIEIPERIKKKLPDGSYVFAILDKIKPLMKENNYFPEYTFHDAIHIENVLKISLNLIPDNIYKKLDNESIEYLVAAILLHDLGMFISQAGLNDLIFGKQKNNLKFDLFNNTWGELWSDYYSKAKRYDDKKLFEIFGDNQPVDKDINGCVPIENNNHQRLLFGDFLRQHHHRLAYEIAKQGLPGFECYIDVFENSNINDVDREIVGLIAFSHGVNLRSIEHYIESYPIDLTKKCPIFYLMTILRIADYLDILDKRAPEIIREKRELVSPISHREFDLNQAVNDLVFEKEKKCFFINAIPNRSTIFLYVKDTLEKIQDELDMCWAILAEKYHCKYELSIYRIMSNLFDDKKVESLNKTFLTKKAELRANHELLTLLVNPLYGYNPAFAVRELLQNSIDACQERMAIDNEKGKVEISIDTENKEFIITDNGIGMSEDVLINYYLVAGSSYRNSDSWKDKYTDDDGSAKICRIGKFGVGVLSTFIIGDEIEVITQHLHDEKGYYFTLDINKESVLDIRRTNSVIGTAIKIHMKDFAVEYFKNKFKIDEWLNWYHLDEPEILIKLDGNLLKRKYVINADNPKCCWHKTHDTCFDELIWSFTPKSLTNDDQGNEYYEDYREYEVILNGIHIVRFLNTFENNQEYNNFWSMDSRYGFAMHLPTISVKDKANEYIKTDLARTNVTGFKLESGFVRNIYKYFIAQILFRKFDLCAIEYPWFHFYKGKIPLAVSDKGYTVLARSFILNTEKDVICFFGRFKNFEKYDVNQDMLKSHFYNSCGYYGSTDALYYRDFLYQDIYVNGESLVQHSEFLPCCVYAILYDRERYGKCSCTMSLADYLKNSDINENYGIYFSIVDNIDQYKNEISKYYEYLKFEEDYDNEEASERQYGKACIIRYSPSKAEGKNEENIMLDLLNEYLPAKINNGLIPFDMEERRKVYTKAFEELEEFMDE